MEMSKIEMVRQAMLELGEVSSQELSTFLEQRYGMRIEARIIPILKASVRGQEVLERARQAARATIQTTEKAGGNFGPGVISEPTATPT